MSPSDSLQTLFAENPLPMWIYDAETLRFLAVNHAATLAYGYSTTEFLAMSLLDLRSPEEAARLLAQRSSPDSPLKKAGIWKHRRKDGSVIEADVTIHRTQQDGRPAILAVAVDATERSRARKSLERTTQRALLLAEASRTLTDAENEKELTERLFTFAQQLVGLPHWWRNRFNPDGEFQTIHWTKNLLDLFSEDHIVAPLQPDSPHIQLNKRLHEEKSTIHISRCDQTLRYLDPEVDAHPLQTYLAIPMVYRGNTVGALIGGSFGAEGCFDVDPMDLQALEHLVGTATQAILRIRAQRSLSESERHFRWFYERNLAGMFRTSPTGTLLECNEAFARMLGWSSPADLKGIDAHVFYAESGDRSVYMAELLAKGSVSGYRVQLLRRDGSPIWVMENVTLIRNSGGEEVLEGILIDISDRKRAEDFERGQRELLTMVVRQRGMGEVFQGLVALITSLHPDLRSAVLLNEPAGLRVVAATPDFDPPLHTATTCLQSGKMVVHGTGWAWPILGRDGEIPGVLTLEPPRLRRPRPEEEELLQTAAQIAALALEHESISRQLAHQAHHDALTGLPNRILLEDRLQLAIAQAQRYDQQLGLLFIDLDGFKLINDGLGHATGDALLQQVASRLGDTLRASDTLARMGGDEFTVILHPVRDAQSAARVGEKMLECFQEPFLVDGQELRVGASMGLALYPQDGLEADILLRHADAAMYRAKALGKGQCQCFTPELQGQMEERLDLERSLHRALDANEFVLHYQPQFRIDGTLAGFEALVRWHHPKLGMVPPMKFIPAAEESGFILPLGRWVLEEACRQVVRWRAMGRTDLVMAVNVSAVQFAQGDWVDTVAKTLSDLNLPPSCLELELTESLVMAPGSEAAHRLEQLRKLGVGIAIDDFGTGYSSLSYLHRLPIDVLKVDQSFVRDLHLGLNDRGGSRPIVVAIVALAKSLGLRVVAEGVETEDQRAFLQALNCDVLQGYLLGRPAPSESFQELILQPNTGLRLA